MCNWRGKNQIILKGDSSPSPMPTNILKAYIFCLEIIKIHAFDHAYFSYPSPVWGCVADVSYFYSSTSNFLLNPLQWDFCPCDPTGPVSLRISVKQTIDLLLLGNRNHVRFWDGREDSTLRIYGARRRTDKMQRLAELACPEESWTRWAQNSHFHWLSMFKSSPHHF